MTYDVYRYIFYGGAALAVICLIIAVVLFFVLRIPHVVGDLSGATERKAVENIRNQNESTGNKTYKSSAVNLARGKLTDKITSTGSLISKPTETTDGAMATSKLNTGQLETDALKSYETSLVENTSSEETTILGAGDVYGETTVLGNKDSGDFSVECEIIFIHSYEIIE